MDNTHLPAGGDEQANQPTEQFWTGAGQATFGNAVPGYRGAGYGGPETGPLGPGGYQPQPGPAGHDQRDRRKALRWSAGLALVALLAGGGAIAGVSLAGNSSPAPASAQSSAATGQAAVLNAALNSAGSAASPAYLDSSGVVAAPAGAAAGTGGSAQPATVAAAARCLRARAAARAAGRPGLARTIRRLCLHPVLRALALRGVHAEFTIRTKSGYKTLAFERGTIQSVSSGQDIVVRAPDGTTWTWNLTSSTVVRRSGQKTATSALATGEQVWAGGPVSGGAMDARLIVIRPQAASTAPASPSGS
jgi:hypothetical protein